MLIQLSFPERRKKVILKSVHFNPCISKKKKSKVHFYDSFDFLYDCLLNYYLIVCGSTKATFYHFVKSINKFGIPQQDPTKRNKLELRQQKSGSLVLKLARSFNYCVIYTLVSQISVQALISLQGGILIKIK